MPGLKEVAKKTEQTSERTQHTASAQESIAGQLLQEWHKKPDRGGAWPQGLDTRHAGQHQHQLLPASIRGMYRRRDAVNMSTTTQQQRAGTTEHELLHSWS
jgi:hypothetical protein